MFFVVILPFQFQHTGCHFPEVNPNILQEEWKDRIHSVGARHQIKFNPSENH